MTTGETRMPNPAWRKVFQQLRKSALLSDGAGLSDAQLLDGFLSDGDEDAFAALVRRHGPMVFGVCRRLLPSWQDAEDAFQATFLVLARKASAIQPRAKVGNWLYGVAYRTALEARTLLAKRRAKERPLRDVAQPEAVDESWRRLQPLLDSELNRLPDKYRMAIVCCDLQGKTRKEAARELGWPEGTVATRLARGRSLLRARLIRQGVTLSATALAALLSGNGASAIVSKALEIGTIKAATVCAAGTSMATGLVSAHVAVLTQGVLKSMFLTKLKLAAGLLVLLSVLGFGTGVGMYAGGTSPTDAAPRISVERPPSNRSEGLKARLETKEAEDVKAIKDVEDWEKVKKVDDGREDKKKAEKKKRRHEEDEDDDEDEGRDGRKKIDKKKGGHEDDEDDDDERGRESKKKAGMKKRGHEDDDEDDDDDRGGKKKAAAKKREREDDKGKGEKSKKAGKKKREREDEEDDDRREHAKKKKGAKKREREREEEENRREFKKKSKKEKRGHEDEDGERRESTKKAGKKKREHEEEDHRRELKKNTRKEKREHEEEEEDRVREGKKKAEKKNRHRQGDDEDRHERMKKAGKKKRQHEDEDEEDKGREGEKKRRHKDQ